MHSYALSASAARSPGSPYVVLISGTHVTGKETLAMRLAEALRCQWLKGETSHAMAIKGALTQAKRGYDYDQVYGRIWISRLGRLGPSYEHKETTTQRGEEASDSGCKAVISCYAMRRPARDAIRHAMQAQNVVPIFAIQQITPQTLSGRTLGAEEPELAKRIMADKTADIEEPLEDEKNDVVILSETSDVDGLFAETLEGVQKVLAAL